MTQAIVLLSGLLCDHRLWAAQLPALEALGDVLVADLTAADSVAALAERVLAAAPARFALAGLSMGGYVAFEILRRAPERVSRLALLDTQARADTEQARARRRGLMQLAEQGEFKGVTPRLLPLFLAPDAMSDPRITGTVQAMAESTGKDAFLRQQMAIMRRPDSRPGLSAIACPTLVLAGREDQVTPPELQLEMAASIPDATLVLLPRCGHLAPLERPEAVTRQLAAWLDG
ncbi:MAG: alpha/beta fold hydrolase [Geminicoccaceae bacterium]